MRLACTALVLAFACNRVPAGAVPVGSLSVSQANLAGNPELGIAADGARRELSRAIEEAYRANKIYTNPNITILMQPTARYVNVGGSVRNPTRVPFTEDMTLLTAINAAGGFNDFADQRHVRLLRGSEAKMYDVRQFRRDPSLDVRLQPGDRIEVPQSFF